MFPMARTSSVNRPHGPIIAVNTIIENTSEILLISNEGQALRVGLKDVPVLGRTTQGVRIMRMNEGDRVASIGMMPEQDKEGEEE